MNQQIEADAVVFDAYGTLFDVASTARRHAAKLGAHWASFADTWRRKQLEYTWIRTLMGNHLDFWHVTGDSLDYAMAVHGVTDLGLRAALMEQTLALDAFPDVKPALVRLRQALKKTVTLSNGTPSMLIAAISSAGLASLMEPPLSVESVGVFKPHPRVYQLAVDRLGLMPARICFVSANGWDAWAGASFGFKAIWINRAKAPLERLPGTLAAIVSSIGEIPDLLGA